MYLTFDFRFVEANECLADVKIKTSLNRGVGCYQISGLYNERNRTYTFIKDKKLYITKFVSTPFCLLKSLRCSVPGIFPLVSSLVWCLYICEG